MCIILFSNFCFLFKRIINFNKHVRYGAIKHLPKSKPKFICTCYLVWIWLVCGITWFVFLFWTGWGWFCLSIFCIWPKVLDCIELDLFKQLLFFLHCQKTCQGLGEREIPYGIISMKRSSLAKKDLELHVKHVAKKCKALFLGWKIIMLFAIIELKLY